MKSTVLYENENGSNEDITLSDSVDKYKYVEIFYKYDGKYNSVKISQPYNKKISLFVFVFFYNSNASNLQFANSIVLLNKDKITCDTHGVYTIQDSVTWIPYGNRTNQIKITKVIGITD